MKQSLLVITLIIVLGCNNNIFSQSGWIGIMPMEYNPSFAGSTGVGRVSSRISYNRLGWERFSQSSDRSIIISTSYDKFISKISSGIGFTFNSTPLNKIGAQLNTQTTSFDGSFIISPKISIKGKYTLAPSLSLGYSRIRSPNFSITGNIFDYNYKNSSYLNPIFGILFNTQNFYVGYSLSYYHWIEHAQNPYFHNNYLGRSILTMGYNFQKSKDAKFSITPQIVMSTSTASFFLSKFTTYHGIFINSKYKNIIFGIGQSGYGNFWKGYSPTRGQAWLMAGFQNKKIRITYVQNLFSKYIIQSLFYCYTGELSFRLLIGSKKGSTF